MTEQIISAGGAAAILAGFAALQFKRLQADQPLYLLLNLFGSIALAIAAVMSGLWAFVVLNCVWATVSFWSLARRRPSS